MNRENSNQVAIVVQARMGSRRLPGKVLLEVLGKPLLFYLLERLKSVDSANIIVVATTKKGEDDVIADYSAQQGIITFRGSENDLVDRYLQAAKAVGAKTIVRITADCPLIDPKVIETVIQKYTKNNFDYVSNTLTLTFPRGMDTEVFSIKTLGVVAKEAKSQWEREHVTPYIYKHPERFGLFNVSYPTNQSHYRLTVDTKEDFLLVKKVIETLYPQKPQFTLGDIIDLLDQNPEIAKINRHVSQKQES